MITGDEHMRVIRWSGLLLVIALCSLSVQSALAQASTQTFNLPPKGKATITFQALCIQFGKKFPAGVNGPSSVASDPVQAA
jgi:hypothetical protein